MKIIFDLIQVCCAGFVAWMGYRRRFLIWPRSDAAEVGGEILMALGLILILMMR